MIAIILTLRFIIFVPANQTYFIIFIIIFFGF